MSWFGTDVVAVGCILGGAAIGGVVTAAFMDGGGHADVRCGVEAMALSPRVSISHSGRARAIVVTPDVRVHAVRDCVREMDGIVEIHMENHMDTQLQHLDIQLEHLDRTLEFELQQLESQLERELVPAFEAREQFEEAMRQMEKAKVKVAVKRIERGGG